MTLYLEKCLGQRPADRSCHVVIPRHIDFRFRLHIVSSRITSSWPDSKKRISSVIGVGMFTIVYSREELEDQGGRRVKVGRRGGGLKFVHSVYVNEPSSRFFFFFLCNIRIKVNGSYFREIMKGQACLGSSVHLFRASLSSSLTSVSLFSHIIPSISQGFETKQTLQCYTN